MTFALPLYKVAFIKTWNLSIIDLGPCKLKMLVLIIASKFSPKLKLGIEILENNKYYLTFIV